MGCELTPDALTASEGSDRLNLFILLIPATNVDCGTVQEYLEMVCDTMEWRWATVNHEKDELNRQKQKIVVAVTSL